MYNSIIAVLPRIITVTIKVISDFVFMTPDYLWPCFLFCLILNLSPSHPRSSISNLLLNTTIRTAPGHLLVLSSHIAASHVRRAPLNPNSYNDSSVSDRFTLILLTPSIYSVQMSGYWLKSYEKAE